MRRPLSQSVRLFAGSLLALCAIGSLTMLEADPPAKSDKQPTQKSEEKTPEKKSPAKSTAKTVDKTSAQRSQPALTPEREAAALHFARAHHPELADLVERLRNEMQVEYGKAIRQLYQTSERLARTKERSEEDYTLQLEQWKIDSRVKLLAARMTISADVKLERQMEKLLRERLALRRQQLVREKERAEARVKRAEASLAELEADERAIEKELARYRKLQPRETTPASVKAPVKSKVDSKIDSKTSTKTDNKKTNSTKQN